MGGNNNDERISELDLYKIWQTFGKNNGDTKMMFEKAVWPDLKVMI